MYEKCHIMTNNMNTINNIIFFADGLFKRLVQIANEKKTTAGFRFFFFF